MLGGMFNSDETVVDKYEYGFTGSFFKNDYFIIDENTRINWLQWREHQKQILMNAFLTIQ